MQKKVIISLCSGTGSWEKPYVESGDYEVIPVTLPENDVRTWQLPDKPIYGILAAPPCTHFSNSGAQYWKAKDADGRTFDDVSILTACLMLIAKAQPKFWVIENPVGRMSRLLGRPTLMFNPCDYGDPYTKKTCLWGVFREPEKNPVQPEYVIAKNGDRYSNVFWNSGGKSEKTKRLRSVTPPGFALAFYKANR